MDETTFQHQLRELKQRVSDMADTSSSWMPVPRPHTHPGLAPGVSPSYHQDLYTAQLRDLRYKLDHMQTYSLMQGQGQAVQTKVPFTAMPEAPSSLDYIRRDIQILAGTIESSNDLAKQNFNDFKRSLEHLSLGMHCDIEFLASRLRKSNAFTPDSSEATDEDLAAAHEGFPVDIPEHVHGDSETSVHTEAQDDPWRVAGEQIHHLHGFPIPSFSEINQPLGPPLSATDWVTNTMNASLHPGYEARHDEAVPKSDQNGLVGGKEGVALPQSNRDELPIFSNSPTAEELRNAFHQGRQTGFEGVTQLIQETCPCPAVLSEPFMAICPPKAFQDTNPEWLANLPELPASCGDTSTKAQLTRQQDDLAKRCSQREDAWNRVDMDSPEQAQFKIEQITYSQLRDAIAAKDEEIAGLEVGQIADRREKDAAIAHLNDCKAAAEEAFEITRSDLEQQLDEAKDRHNESVASIDRWKEYAESCQRNLEAVMEARRKLQEKRETENRQFTFDLRQCEASRHHFMTKYVDENYRFKWLEQRKLQSEQGLQQQLEECEAALENSERYRDADISNALHSRDEELEKLHVFCEEKDAVVARQEQIIAQGASILQERDAEIDRLSAALDESRHSEQDAREHAAKNKRTIQKRDAQLEDLHRDIKGERERRCRLEDLMRRDAEALRTKANDARFSVDERDSGKSFANAADVPAYAVSRGQSGRQKPLWTPQPIPSSARLPHEEDRASFWEDGEHATTKHRFGSASPIVQLRRKPGRGGPNNEGPLRGNVNHERQSSSNNVTEEESRGQHRQHRAMYPDPSRHQSDPLETNREALQLLAGWTETLQGQQQKNNRPHERQKIPEAPLSTRQTHADMSHQQTVAGGGGSGGGRRSPSSRMKAQAPTNGGTAENGRHALPLDTTWLPAPAQPAVVERVVSVPDLRAGSGCSESRNHAAREHSAMSKPASMFDLRPQKRYMPSPRQTYRAPSVETEAESSSSSSADERERNSLVDYS